LAAISTAPRRFPAAWFPQLADTRLRQTSCLEIARHHEYTTAQLKLGVTRATIHQRLRDEHGLSASVVSVKRYVAANLPEEVRRDRVVVLRDETDVPPGEEAQQDYGHFGLLGRPAVGQAAPGVGVRDGASASKRLQPNARP
jgi:hypothetical protein